MDGETLLCGISKAEKRQKLERSEKTFFQIASSKIVNSNPKDELFEESIDFSVIVELL